MTGGSSDILKDRMEILNLEGAYAHTWDTVNAAGWADLFTADGVFFSVGVSPELAEYQFQGRDQLAGFCRTVNIDWEWRGMHLIHAPHLEVHGDRAEGWINFEFRSSHKGDIGHTAGVYQVFYVRTSDGWRIQKRIERIVEHTVGGVTTWHGYPEGTSAL